MKDRFLYPVFLSVLIVLQGCSTSYPIIEPSQETKPSWTDTTPPNSEGFAYLVGISDETHASEIEARDAARGKAAQLFVKQCRLKIEIFEEYISKFSAKTSAVIDEQKQAHTQSRHQGIGHVGFFRHQESYSQKITSQPSSNGSSHVSYKIWSLFQYPENECEKMIAWNRQREELMRQELNNILNDAKNMAEQRQFQEALEMLKTLKQSANQQKIIESSPFISKANSLKKIWNIKWTRQKITHAITHAKTMAEQGNLHEALKQLQHARTEAENQIIVDATQMMTEVALLENLWTSSFELQVLPKSQTLLVDSIPKTPRVQAWFIPKQDAQIIPVKSFPLQWSVSFPTKQTSPPKIQNTDAQGIMAFQFHRKFKRTGDYSFNFQTAIQDSNISFHVKNSLNSKIAIHQIQIHSGSE